MLQSDGCWEAQVQTEMSHVCWSAFTLIFWNQGSCSSLNEAILTIFWKGQMMAVMGHQNPADLLEHRWETVTRAEGSGEKEKVRTSAWAWSWFYWAWGCCVWPACGLSRCLTTAIRTAGRTRTCTWENTPNTQGKCGEIWGIEQISSCFSSHCILVLLWNYEILSNYRVFFFF